MRGMGFHVLLLVAVVAVGKSAYAERIISVRDISGLSPSAGVAANPDPAVASRPAAPKANAIKLRGLNKVTARTSSLEGLLGTVMHFGNLEIIAHRCWQSAPEDQPESAALLEIWELESAEEPGRIFSGWMFASSPALSALENPVYDISVIGCTNIQGEQ